MTSTALPALRRRAARLRDLSAITDQHLAGAGMCFLEFLIFGIAMAAVFVSFLTRDEQRAALEDRIAGACRRAQADRSGRAAPQRIADERQRLGGSWGRGPAHLCAPHQPAGFEPPLLLDESSCCSRSSPRRRA